MSDPSFNLQVAQVGILKGNSGVTGLISDRVYDDIPSKPEFPYVNVGEGHVLGDDTEDCGDASEVFSQIHAWSQKKNAGLTEVKRIAAAVRTALKSPPALAGFTVTVVEYVQTQYLKDPDGITRHAMVEFRYLIDHS